MILREQKRAVVCGELRKCRSPLLRMPQDLRLVRAVAAEQHEEWMEGSRYLNADLLREQLKPMKSTIAIAT